MPTLTVKQVIVAELLRVCKDVTRTLRDKDAKKEKKTKFSDAKVEEFHKMVANFWTGDNQAKFCKIFAHLLDAPELKHGSMLPLELFAVVLIGPGSHHAYPTGVPLIVTYKEDRCLWNPPDGAITNWKLLPSDKPRYATDDEVEQCIKDLTPVQWQKLHVFDVFKPIMDAAMNRAVTVEEPADNGELEDDNEIVLKDGRTITLAGAPDFGKQ